ncbi:MAG TPA: tetratricopeptide repeat protein [Candidatus Krumholzibacteria bacterium]|nr:tetratricopeptide repeat protein [Candidatus Krumholzibacteria bacterium]
MTATAKRRQMKEDQLVTTTVRLSEWAQAHFNQVIIGVVALVAAVAVVVFVANSRQSTARQSERQMGSALTLMQQGDMNAARTSFEQLSQSGGGKYAVVSRFFKAECELRLGNYAQAVTDYDAYLAKKTAYPTFAAAAAIGKGMACEGLQQWAEAATALVSALDALDTTDPRYYDTAFRAAAFYDRAGNHEAAEKYFQIVADGGTGEIRDRAAIALSALN